MVFPPTHWFQGLGAGGIRDVGDIEFLTKKEFDGKLKKNEGFKSTTGDLATLTASSGKDMYLARAKVIFFANVASAEAIADEVVLKINDVIVETAKSASSSGTQFAWSYEFRNIGHKVAATQIIKLEVITLDTQVDVEGFVECFEETTGETPVI